MRKPPLFGAFRKAGMTPAAGQTGRCLNRLALTTRECSHGSTDRALIARVFARRGRALLILPRLYSLREAVRRSLLCNNVGITWRQTLALLGASVAIAVALTGAMVLIARLISTSF